MVERYHLVLAGWAFIAGLVIAAATCVAPAFLQRRLIALAGLAGAMLGSLDNPRAMPWLVGAVVMVLWGDNPARPHPLGEWAAPLALVSLVGVWASVPDTEPALAVGAALAPIALIMALLRRPVGPGGTAALAVAVFGAVWVGSAGWGAALATVCAVGMVAAVPGAVGFRRARLMAAGWIAVIATHVLIAWPLPRLIMRRSVPVAVLLSAGGMLAAIVVAFVVAKPIPQIGGCDPVAFDDGSPTSAEGAGGSG